MTVVRLQERQASSRNGSNGLSLLTRKLLGDMAYRFKVRLGMRPVKVAFRGEIKNPAAAGIRPRFRPHRFPTPETGFPASCRHERVCRSTPNATRPRPQNQRAVFSARDRKRSDGPEKGGQGAPVRRAALRRPIRLPPKKTQQKSERSGHKSEHGTDSFSFFC